MKDSHIGAFGVLALVLVLLGQWVCVTVWRRGDTWMASCRGVLSRTMLVDLAVSHPYARPKAERALRLWRARIRSTCWRRC
jgi:cobalamin synthase